MRWPTVSTPCDTPALETHLLLLSPRGAVSSSRVESDARGTFIGDRRNAVSVATAARAAVCRGTRWSRRSFRRIELNRLRHPYPARMQRRRRRLHRWRRPGRSRWRTRPLLPVTVETWPWWMDGWCWKDGWQHRRWKLGREWFGFGRGKQVGCRLVYFFK